MQQLPFCIFAGTPVAVFFGLPLAGLYVCGWVVGRQNMGSDSLCEAWGGDDLNGPMLSQTGSRTFCIASQIQQNKRCLGLT